MTSSAYAMKTMTMWRTNLTGWLIDMGRYDTDLSVIHDMTVGEIFTACSRLAAAGNSKKAGMDLERATVLVVARNILARYDFTKKGLDMDFKTFLKTEEKVDWQFVHIHRIGYVMYYQMQEVYDYLEEKRQMTANVKRYWKLIENGFRQYQLKHKSISKGSAWVTLQDHMRLVNDALTPMKQTLEDSIRDYLIWNRKEMVGAGQKDDITLLSKVGVTLLFVAARDNTYKGFIARSAEDYGIDFRNSFGYAELGSLGRNFVWMMRQVGVRFDTDKDGDAILLGTDYDRSVRVNASWDAMTRALTDDELMDSLSIQAICMNPEAKADYNAVIAEEEQKALDRAIDKLKQQPNVKSEWT